MGYFHRGGRGCDWKRCTQEASKVLAIFSFYKMCFLPRCLLSKNEYSLKNMYIFTSIYFIIKIQLES